MESEEFEQIPWASLVAEQENGIDKRIYLAAGAIGLLVVAVLGMRLLDGDPQPIPPETIAVIATSSTVAQSVISESPPTSLIVSEADLRAAPAAVPDSADYLVEVTAEWFVIDWYTRDGSDETVRSVRAALAPSASPDILPHETDGEPVTFVEWAKAVGSEATAAGIDVRVAYRAIREGEEGFVRDPVAEVMVTVEREGDMASVTGAPRPSS